MLMLALLHGEEVLKERRVLLKYICHVLEQGGCLLLSQTCRPHLAQVFALVYTSGGAHALVVVALADASAAASAPEPIVGANLGVLLLVGPALLHDPRLPFTPAATGVFIYEMGGFLARCQLLL